MSSRMTRTESMAFWRKAENIETLVRMWNANEDCSKIGAAMGISRDAVIGKAHSLKLPQHANSNFKAMRKAPAQENNAAKMRRYYGSDPLPPFHPVAAAVLAEAGLAFG